jgi:hypothetical protein
LARRVGTIHSIVVVVCKVPFQANKIIPTFWSWRKLNLKIVLAMIETIRCIHTFCNFFENPTSFTLAWLLQKKSDCHNSTIVKIAFQRGWRITWLGHCCKCW